MMNRFIKFIVAVALVFTMCVCTFAPLASAVLNNKGSITLHVTDKNTELPVEGIAFRLYMVATVFKNGDGLGYSYISPYDKSNIDMGDLQDSYLPIHLTTVALSYNAQHTELLSDKNGMIYYSDLVPGVYLCVASGNMNSYFTPAPFIISVPFFDKENNTLIFDVNATPKMQYQEPSDFHETTYISVKKQWETNGNHPDSVTVCLLRDFTEIDRVTLSNDNNWHFRWDNLSKNHSWSVSEIEVPSGYTVSYESSSNTVTITNKKDVPPDTPDTPETTTSTDDEPTTKPDELVDTGQLNWPVPVLSVAGLLLFAIGWAIINLGKKENA